ncbi:MAG TPA: hypothetical protein VF043_38925 [Ktedonobacteraceae bacterium]
MALLFPDEENARRIEDLRSELNTSGMNAGCEFIEEMENQIVLEVQKYISGEKNESALFSVVNAFVTSLNLSPFNAFGQMRIREVDGREARKILAFVLTENLAYGPTGIISGETALVLMEPMLRLFTSSVRYFTNAKFTSDPFRLLSWSPIAGSRTFDTGIVLVDDQHVGIIWATAED